MRSQRDQHLAADDRTLLGQCHVDTYRASGPGGQKRNKTDSAVRLRHQPTGLIAIAEESRSQHDNRTKALKRLRHTIALDFRVHINPETYTPSDRLAACVSTTGRFQLGRRDHRYPAVIAELLDLLYADRGQVSSVAERLNVTTANLVTFLRRDEKLIAHVNRLRADAGHKPLR